jgi:hypothetical protein
MFKKSIIVLIYYRHELLDLIKQDNLKIVLSLHIAGQTIIALVYQNLPKFRY